MRARKQSVVKHKTNQHKGEKQMNDEVKTRNENQNQSHEYRSVPVEQLQESPTNPRKRFDETTIKELADSFKSQGVLAPLVVRELAEGKYEVVAGARRLRAARLAGMDSVPVRVVTLSDAAAIEVQVVENLQREDIHPLEEAFGYKQLLDLQDPNYTTASIAAKAGKSEAYVQGRVKLTGLIAPVAESFLNDKISIGHALLIAKLPPKQHQEAFNAAFRQVWTAEGNKGVLIPVREFAHWIESNLMLELSAAPFNKQDESLLPQAGSCMNCPKRTGFNTLLFSDVRKDSCTDRECFQAKVDAHVSKTIEAKPQLVQISSAWNNREGAPLSRHRYVELHLKKAATAAERSKLHPSQQPCAKMREAVVMDGGQRGQIVRVCADPDCKLHHPGKATVALERERERDRVEERKRMEKQKLALSIRHRILAAILKQVEHPLRKADLLQIAFHLAARISPQSVLLLAKRHRVEQSNKAADAPEAGLRRMMQSWDEVELSRFLMECILLETAYSPFTHPERDELAATAKRYRVKVEAIAEAAKEEFAAQAKKKPEIKPKQMAKSA